jgi:hypothetical protein
MKLLRMVRTLMALLAVGLSSSAAQAVIKITEVELSVDIEDVNAAGGDASGPTTILARFVVRGSGFTAVSVTPPGSTMAQMVPLMGSEFVLEQSFADETELDTGLPTGDYFLQAQLGSAETATATLSYQRPDVPSPAISQPTHRSVVLAGSVRAEFEPCADCILSGDSTVATLEQDGTSLATQTLAKGAAEWVPSDAAGPLQLPPTSGFTLAVVHTASRPVAVTPSSGDPFTFRSIFSRSDEVQFSTGFLPPEGNVCLVVNDPERKLYDPANETCTVVSDSLRGILDVGGTSSVVAAGLPIRYELALSPGGRLSGIAAADLDGDGTSETHVPVQGRLRGSGGRLRQTLRFSLEGGPFVAGTSLRVSILERALLADQVKTRKQTTKGDLLGAPVSETLQDADSIEDLPAAWRLDFALSGGGGRISGATLELLGATPLLPNRKVSLSGRHRFSFEFDRTNVRLSSAGGDKGVKIEANGLRFNEAGTISRGEIRWRAFGQAGRLRFRDG